MRMRSSSARSVSASSTRASRLAGDDATRSARLARLTAIVATVPVLVVDNAVAARYGELRRESGRTPSNDLWIAATALAHDLTLITRDDRLATLPLVRVRHVA